MTSEELCMALLRAESEAEVSNVLDELAPQAGVISWCPLDGRETNFNVVTNQASTGAKALTELCTNMVDAILLRHAYEAGIDPTSAAAPQSVTQAVRDLVRLRGARAGILAEVDDLVYLKEYAESNLVIGVTGTDDLCFTFVDAGEGQRPNDFEHTFLSLSSGSKSRIPFVQGKYNMGSAGVLSFCGRCWYKLVVSRRFDGSDPWGWSLMRRRPGDGPPVAEYLKLDREIPRFERAELYPIVLPNGRPDDKVRRSSGTIVKLYSYDFGEAANFRTIREALNENLISTVLPFRLMNYRFGPRTHGGGRRAQGVDERTVSGMDVQLRRLDEEDETEAEELADNPLHIAEIKDPKLGTVRVRAVPLPSDLPGWLKARRNRMRVYHAVNGQVQYKQGRDYLSTQCGLPGLKDHVVILVDASDLTESAHNDVWKGDRETIRQTEVGRYYVLQITEAIRSSTSLKRLQERIKEEKTEQLAKRAQVDLFQSVVSSDPHIAQLLPGGVVVRLPGQRRRSGGVAEYEGKYSPTFVELIGGRLRKSGVDLEVDERRRIRFKTDAASDWLTRPDSRGSVRFVGDDGADARFGFNAELTEGILTVRIRATQDQVSVGETFKTEIRLADDGMPVAVTDAVTFHVVASRRKPSGGGGGRRPRGNDDEEGDRGERDLPDNRWITQDGRVIGDEKTKSWTDIDDDFTDQDGGCVDDLSAGEKLYYINYDNAHFQHFLSGERTDIEKHVLTEQYRLSMLILMMGFEDAYSRLEGSRGQVELAEWIDPIRRLAAQGAATVVMSIAKTLPKLVTADTVGDPDDD